MDTLVPLWLILVNVIITGLVVGFGFYYLEEENLSITPMAFFCLSILAPLVVFVCALLVWSK